jgi:uncharacterized protein
MMQKRGERRLYSASDLVNFMGCMHATVLDIRQLDDPVIALDREGGERLDFFEVHLDEAIAKLRLKARGKIARQVAREEAIETKPRHR